MIDAIYIAAEYSQTQKKVSEVTVHAGKGIVGDRNYDQSKWPGQNITFIEQEEIDNYKLSQSQNINQESTRRNIITKDIRLNDLVGKKFKIGNVQFIGVELCQPCMFLGELLSNETISPKRVVKSFLHKGGLRADILNNGTIACGMKFESA